MKGTIGGVVGLVGVMLSAGLVQAQTAPSLADLARQEQARRQAIPQKTRVYTNDDVRDVQPLSLMGQQREEAPAAGKGAGTGEAVSGVGDGPGGEPGEGKVRGESAGKAGGPARAPEVGGADEAQWRQRMVTARDQLSRARLQLDAMRTRVGALAAAGVTATEGEVGRVRAQQQETLQEYDRLRADVARFQQALADLEVQARQANVPPGWLR